MASTQKVTQVLKQLWLNTKCLAREFTLINLSVYQFILSFFTVSSSNSKATKWFLVAKLMKYNGVKSNEDNKENVNESQFADTTLNTLLIEGTNNVENMQVANERFEVLKNPIESVDNGLEIVFRRLIKTRASLSALHLPIEYFL
ncbi:hypothetical protein VNO78_34422 [Psophocarpus tetragonolobus]|uniref:Uncharacterized protein n=1 Tax=Psophocarpus tetragonolobus TaxID=3891 RepID=A0AAN9NZ34_PSOTE